MNWYETSELKRQKEQNIRDGQSTTMEIVENDWVLLNRLARVSHSIDNKSR